MADLTGRITAVSFSYETGKPQITLEVNEKHDALCIADAYRGVDKLAVRIERWREKRSLDANAYCFVLIGKLAEKLNVPKSDVYRAAIKEIGGNYDVVCVKDEAVEALRNGWERNGLGWQTDTMDSKIEGCTNVVLYYGSSTYDKRQMSRLIENIVEDCKSQGIETKTPAELASLLNAWRE